MKFSKYDLGIWRLSDNSNTHTTPPFLFIGPSQEFNT